MDSLSDEKYPLLLLYVEEGGKRSEYPRRVVFAEKARGNPLTQGAATIITQWPGHVTSCWVTALVLGAALTFLTILLSAASINSSMSYISHQRCPRDTYVHHGNKTIHIIHDDAKWSIKQLELLKYVAEIYSEYEIHILNFDSKPKHIHISREKEPVIKIIVDNENITKVHTTTKPPKITKPYNRSIGENEDVIFYENPFKHIKAYSFLEKLRNNLRTGRFSRSAEVTEKLDTYEKVIKKYRNIKPETTSYKKYFLNTPFQHYWMSLDRSMLLFASRIQELWNHGGLSFYFPPNNDETIQKDSNTLSKNNSKLAKYDLDFKTNLKNVIFNSKPLYEKLNNDLVSIDGKGLHMGTKIACHSFFGEMTIKLLAQIDTISVPTLIRETLDGFCKRGAVDSDYCKSMQY